MPKLKLPAAIAAVLFGLVFWTFIPSLRNGFIALDDPAYLSDNIYVRNGFSWVGASWAFTNSVGGSWHPLTWFSLMLDCQLYGLRPAGHHLTDLLLHATSTLLVFAFFFRTTGAMWRSALVAALFGLHPLRVESVAWAAERKDTLSTLFWMLTLLAYARYAECSRARSPIARRFYVLTLICFACGLMSKPMLVTLPVVLLLLDGWPLRRFDLPLKSPANLSLIKEKLPFFGLAALIAVVTFFTQQDMGAITALSYLPLTYRIENAALSYWRYLAEMVWPSKLALFYPLPSHLGLASSAIAALGLVLITLLSIRAFRAKPFATLGWLWYLVTLLPVIGLIQAGQQSHADRYTYIPLLGIYVLIIWLGHDWLQRLPRCRLILVPVSLAAVIACVWSTRVQLRYWRDSETLFRRSLAITTDNALAENILGTLLIRDGRLDEGLPHLTAAVRLAPSLAFTHNDLGVALGKKGRENEAFQEFLEAIRLKPNFPEAHRNLAIALDNQGYPNEAIVHLQEAVKLKPDYTPARRSLGIILAKRGWLNEALEHLQEVVRLDPDDALAHCNLGITFGKKGRLDEAISELQKAVKLQPSNAEAQCNLGVALGARGRIEESLAHLQEALKLRPDYPDAQANLKFALDAKAGGDRSGNQKNSP